MKETGEKYTVAMRTLTREDEGETEAGKNRKPSSEEGVVE